MSHSLYESAMKPDEFAVWLEGFFALARPVIIDGEALAELRARCMQAAADVRDRMAFDAMVKRERVSQELEPIRSILGPSTLQEP